MIVSHWSPLKRQIGELLIRKTLRPGEFPFRARDDNSSLPLSPAYFDIRRENLKENERHIHGMFLCRHVEFSKFSAVVGVPDAATPFAQHFAAFYTRRIVKFLELDKSTGKLKREVEPGMPTLVLENAISSGGSTREKAIAPLERHGLEVAGILTILDWELGGKESLEQDGYHVQAVFTASDLIAHAVTLGLAPDDLHPEVQAFQQEWRRVAGTLKV